LPGYLPPALYPCNSYHPKQQEDERSSVAPGRIPA